MQYIGLISFDHSQDRCRKERSILSKGSAFDARNTSTLSCHHVHPKFSTFLMRPNSSSFCIYGKWSGFGQCYPKLTSRAILFEQSLQRVDQNLNLMAFSSSPTAEPPSMDDDDALKISGSIAPKPTKRKVKLRKSFVPRKAAISLTPKCRKLFRNLLSVANSDVAGVMVRFRQASNGQPRMCFTFDFVTSSEIGPNDEGVSLEVQEDGITPKSPIDSQSDGLPKLYIHHNAFIKVLGSMIDVGDDGVSPILFDRQGNKLDPNQT